MPINNQYTYRNTIIGVLPDFLNEEKFDMGCWLNPLTNLINSMSSYREEGVVLFPVVYAIHEIDQLKQVNPSEIIPLGSGASLDETLKLALKKCSPLAIEGWAIYVQSANGNSSYGLFRSTTGILSTPLETLLIGNGEIDSTPIILIHQILDKVVELRGTRGNRIVFNFTTRKNDDDSAIINQSTFIDRLTLKGKNTDQLVNFYKRLFRHILLHGHGNLIVVLDLEKSIPGFLNGKGIVLPSEIDVDTLIGNQLQDYNHLNTSALESAFRLSCGMLKSDGITVFRNNGAVVGFNYLIEHLPEHQELFKGVIGGSRSKTFAILEQKVRMKEIAAAYIQSQDGEIKISI